MRRHKAHSDRFVAWPGFKSGTIDTGLKKNVWLNAMKILCGEPVKVRTKAELIPIAERVKGKKYRYTHDTVRRPAIFRRSRRNNGGWLYELIESPKPSVAIPTEKTPQERLDRISDAALRSSIQGHARRLVEHRGIKQGDAINQALALFEPAIRRLETATAAKSV
jgi:hypothetical protein